MRAARLQILIIQPIPHHQCGIGRMIRICSCTVQGQSRALSCRFATCSNNNQRNQIEFHNRASPKRAVEE